MSYYPQSKILTNQYTSGKEFILKLNSQLYVGYYYALSNNTFFTGKNSDDPSSQELIKLSTINENTNTAYVNPQPKKGSFTNPVPYYVVPTSEDYKIGFITRYFVKKRNADYTKIVEISPNEYETYFSFPSDDLNTSLYVAVKLNWKITGPLNNDFRDKNFPKSGILETNKKIVQLKEVVFPGFSYYFNDYSQFSKPD